MKLSPLLFYTVHSAILGHQITLENFEELKNNAEQHALKCHSEGLRRFQKWKEQNKRS